ncbi:hypothetical protein Efla_000417 [Eimeria flavescens]
MLPSNNWKHAAAFLLPSVLLLIAAAADNTAAAAAVEAAAVAEKDAANEWLFDFRPRSLQSLLSGTLAGAVAPEQQQQQDISGSGKTLFSKPCLLRAAAAGGDDDAKADKTSRDVPSSHSSDNKDSKGSSSSSSSRGNTWYGSLLSSWGWEHETARMWLLIGCSAFLVAFAGVSSGLTTGFMAFDELQLLVLQETGSEAERAQWPGPAAVAANVPLEQQLSHAHWRLQKQQQQQGQEQHQKQQMRCLSLRARKVHELLSRRHQLLVTLLVANSLAMEALPLFLDRLVSPFHAVLLAVTLILFFGEILPQAVCTGRNQLAVAAVMTPLVRLLLVAFAFVAIPVAALLDRLLQPSHAAAFYGRNHLRALIGLHQRGRRRLLREASSEESGENGGLQAEGGKDASPWLNKDEVMVIQGALDMASKVIGDFLVPMNQVYQLEKNTKLTPDVLLQILRRGHSRIPVYEGERHNIRGILLVKSLICIDPGAGLTVGDVMKTKAYRSYSRPLFVSPSINPYTLLNAFQESRCHLAFVTPDFLAYGEAWRDGRPPPPDATLLGIVTLEDVMEQLIQEEIMDEFDRKKDTSQFAMTRPTEVTLNMGSCEPEPLSASFSSADAANGVFFYASTVSRELDAYPLPPSSAAAAATAEPPEAAGGGALRAAGNSAACSFAPMQSAEDIATAPCVLDGDAAVAARNAAQSANRAAASSRSAAGEYSHSPSGFESLCSFSVSEQQQQQAHQLNQRVGVFIQPGSTGKQGAPRRGRSRATQSQRDTLGRWLKRRCFTQPFAVLAGQQQQEQQQEQQQQQQQQHAEGTSEAHAKQGLRGSSSSALETVPYAVLMPSRDSRRSSNGSRSSSRSNSCSKTPQVICMLTPAASALGRSGRATPACGSAARGPRTPESDEPGVKAELLPKDSDAKEPPPAGRPQRLPGAPNGGYALLTEGP